MHNSRTGYRSLDVGFMWLNHLSLRVFGISLRDDEHYLYKLYALFIFIISMSSPIGGLITISENLSSPTIIAENLAIGGALFIGTVKFLSMLYIRKDFVKHMNQLNNGIFIQHERNKDETEKRIVENGWFHVKCLFFIYHMFPTMYIVFANTPVLLKRHFSIGNGSEWFLPFGGFPAFDTEKSPNFEIALIYQNISNYSTYIIYSTYHCMVVTVMIYLNVQCLLLQNVIKTCIERCRRRALRNGKNLSIVRWCYLKDEVKAIVRYHDAIIDISKKFSDDLAFTTLIDFFGMSVILANGIFYSFTINQLNFRTIQILTLASSTIVTEFVMSYWSSEFVFNFLKIGHVCYEIDFIDTDIKFQKALNLLILRSQKPVEFTVGNFSSLNMETFITILKGAYSCFMVLHHSEV
ncbi:hypothetical protein FQA39_LY13383 [Lamprigera yunnana]|nr:hypothetical protein FQA39_LY13383 [Lamprigera yunnana]